MRKPRLTTDLAALLLAYLDRQPGAGPVLADYLEEQGCDLGLAGFRREPDALLPRLMVVATLLSESVQRRLTREFALACLPLVAERYPYRDDSFPIDGSLADIWDPGVAEETAETVLRAAYVDILAAIRAHEGAAGAEPLIERWRSSLSVVAVQAAARRGHLPQVLIESRHLDAESRQFQADRIRQVLHEAWAGTHEGAFQPAVTPPTPRNS